MKSLAAIVFCVVMAGYLLYTGVKRLVCGSKTKDDPNFWAGVMPNLDPAHLRTLRRGDSDFGDWKTVYMRWDSDSTGTAHLRLLPMTVFGPDTPFHVSWRTHYLGTSVVKCGKTLVRCDLTGMMHWGGGDCHVCDAYNYLYNVCGEGDKRFMQNLKPVVRYYVNVLTEWGETKVYSVGRALFPEIVRLEDEFRLSDPNVGRSIVLMRAQKGCLDGQTYPDYSVVAGRQAWPIFYNHGEMEFCLANVYDLTALSKHHDRTEKELRAAVEEFLASRPEYAGLRETYNSHFTYRELLRAEVVTSRPSCGQAKVEEKDASWMQDVSFPPADPDAMKRPEDFFTSPKESKMMEEANRANMKEEDRNFLELMKIAEESKPKDEDEIDLLCPQDREFVDKLLDIGGEGLTEAEAQCFKKDADEAVEEMFIDKLASHCGLTEAEAESIIKVDRAVEALAYRSEEEKEKYARWMEQLWDKPAKLMELLCPQGRAVEELTDPQGVRVELPSIQMSDADKTTFLAAMKKVIEKKVKDGEALVEKVVDDGVAAVKEMVEEDLATAVNLVKDGVAIVEELIEGVEKLVENDEKFVAFIDKEQMEYATYINDKFFRTNEAVNEFLGSSEVELNVETTEIKARYGPSVTLPTDVTGEAPADTSATEKPPADDAMSPAEAEKFIADMRAKLDELRAEPTTGDEIKVDWFGRPIVSTQGVKATFDEMRAKGEKISAEPTNGHEIRPVVAEIVAKDVHVSFDPNYEAYCAKILEADAAHAVATDIRNAFAAKEPAVPEPTAQEAVGEVPPDGKSQPGYLGKRYRIVESYYSDQQPQAELEKTIAEQDAILDAQPKGEKATTPPPPFNAVMDEQKETSEPEQNETKPLVEKLFIPPLAGPSSLYFMPTKKVAFPIRLRQPCRHGCPICEAEIAKQKAAEAAEKKDAEPTCDKASRPRDIIGPGGFAPTCGHERPPQPSEPACPMCEAEGAKFAESPLKKPTDEVLKSTAEDPTQVLYCGGYDVQPMVDMKLAELKKLAEEQKTVVWTASQGKSQPLHKGELIHRVPSTPDAQDESPVEEAKAVQRFKGKFQEADPSGRHMRRGYPLVGTPDAQGEPPVEEKESNEPPVEKTLEARWITPTADEDFCLGVLPPEPEPPVEQEKSAKEIWGTYGVEYFCTNEDKPDHE